MIKIGADFQKKKLYFFMANIPNSDLSKKEKVPRYGQIMPTYQIW